MASDSPTSRTLAECRRRGWTAQVVERWLPGTRKNRETGTLERTPYGTRKDLFGLGDILALDGQPGSLLIQACAGGDAAKRAAKVRDLPELRAWLDAGNRFEVWAWREAWIATSERHKAKRWGVRVLALSLDEDEPGQVIQEVQEAPLSRPPDAPPDVTRQQWEEGGASGEEP